MMKIDITHSFLAFLGLFLFTLGYCLYSFLVFVHFYFVFIILSEIAGAALLGAVDGSNLVPSCPLVLEGYVNNLLVVQSPGRFVIDSPLCFPFVLLLYNRTPKDHI